MEAHGFTVDVQYVMYKSPSEAFGRSEEVGATVSYDDRRFWPASSPIVSLNPSVAYFWEFDDNKDGERDSYFGVSLEPELHPVHFSRVPVTFSFPLTFGGSWDGYYFDDHGGVDQAGFWTAGLKAAVDLPTGDRFPCRLEAEVDYIRLMADSVERQRRRPRRHHVPRRPRVPHVARAVPPATRGRYFDSPPSSVIITFLIIACDPPRLSSWKPMCPRRGRSFSGGALVSSWRFTGVLCSSRFTSWINSPFSSTFTSGPFKLMR